MAKSLAGALFILALMVGAQAAVVCNIDTNKLDCCEPAVTSTRPKRPTKQCCSLVRRADLACLCSYKDVLPAVGIDPKKAFALPKKCGVPPPPCKV